MLNYFFKLWRGDKDFWHVFWVWIVAINGPWVIPTLDLNFFQTGIAHSVLEPLKKYLHYNVYPFFHSIFPEILLVTIAPLALFFLYRSSNKNIISKTFCFALIGVYLYALFKYGIWIFFLLLLGFTKWKSDGFQG